MLVCSTSANAQDKPNIVLLFADNFGYGELGAYGGGLTRGAPTPRLDALARQGMRLTNFNVEPSCTPSRSALMVGRHPIRDGTYSVPANGQPYGLVQWEVTIANCCPSAVTRPLFTGNGTSVTTRDATRTTRASTNGTGYQIPPTKAYGRTRRTLIPPLPTLSTSMEGRHGEQTRRIKLYDADARREIDSEITDQHDRLHPA